MCIWGALLFHCNLLTGIYWGADTRLNAQENRRLPLPKPPLPNPLAHVREPKVRFSIDDRAPSITSGGSAYQLGASSCICHNSSHVIEQSWLQPACPDMQLDAWRVLLQPEEGRPRTWW